MNNTGRGGAELASLFSLLHIIYNVYEVRCTKEPNGGWWGLVIFFCKFLLTHEGVLLYHNQAREIERSLR